MLVRSIWTHIWSMLLSCIWTILVKDSLICQICDFTIRCPLCHTSIFVKEVKGLRLHNSLIMAHYAIRATQNTLPISNRWMWVHFINVFLIRIHSRWNFVSDHDISICIVHTFCDKIYSEHYIRLGTNKSSFPSNSNVKNGNVKARKFSRSHDDATMLCA